VTVKTIREYYQILEDTLVGRQLEAWRKHRKRRLIETAKFYFFDVGIASGLLNHQTLTPGTIEYGRAFEHFILQEIWAYRHYSRKDFPIGFWRTAGGAEVDLILGEAEVAIEVKSSAVFSGRTKGLHLFCDEQPCQKAIVITRGKFPQKTESGVELQPWPHFCSLLWNGDII
jgi:uncharacterized protein